MWQELYLMYGKAKSWEKLQKTSYRKGVEKRKREKEYEIKKQREKSMRCTLSAMIQKKKRYVENLLRRPTRRVV